MSDAAAVAEEVRLAVREAARDGDMVTSENIARAIASAYPNSGLSYQQIAEWIRTAATNAGVQVSATDPLERHRLPVASNR